MWLAEDQLKRSRSADQLFFKVSIFTFKYGSDKCALAITDILLYPSSEYATVLNRCTSTATPGTLEIPHGCTAPCHSTLIGVQTQVGASDPDR